ncbi:unnamed protein product [Amoebophrya sp. A120]|nr:unnamed protein product [Amoebophrya sp. A120]|eukprot:GSA120T00023852001.1
MLLRQREPIFSCYFSSSSSNPKQAYNRPHLPALQHTSVASCILCIKSYSNFVHFDPDTPKVEGLRLAKQEDYLFLFYRDYWVNSPVRFVCFRADGEKGCSRGDFIFIL